MKTATAFDIRRFLAVLRAHHLSWNAPVITLMAGNHASPFELLVSTVLSLRTKDQVTAAAAARLLAAARSPAALLELDPDEVGRLIHPVGFWQTKAVRLRQICRRLLQEHGGRVPADLDALLALPGVGRKTANLVLAEGFGIPAICVDTHVHRISNRIGYIRTKTPEQSERRLRRKLPRRYWIEYNKLLVAFGQTICQPVSPFCSRCPAAALCRRIHVTHRR